MSFWGGWQSKERPTTEDIANSEPSHLRSIGSSPLENTHRISQMSLNSNGGLDVWVTHGRQIRKFSDTRLQLIGIERLKMKLQFLEKLSRSFKTCKEGRRKKAWQIFPE